MLPSRTLLAVSLLLALWSAEAKAERSEPLLSPAQVSSASPAGALAAVRDGAGSQALEPFHLAPGEGVPRGYEARLSPLFGEIAADRVMLALCRAGFHGCSGAGRRFLAVIEGAQGKHGRARLGEINRSINLAVTYMSDETQHGHADVWSSPLATFETLKGDCEDYAIAKYVALLELGVAAEDLRLVVVRSRRAGEGHAVLATRQDGHWLVLDNRSFLMIADDDLGRYAALAAFTLSPSLRPSAG